MSVLKIETHLPMGEDLVITKVHEAKEIVPAYSCIGGNMEYRTKEESYPELFAVLKNMSKLGTWFFWSLMESRNTITNEATFKACCTSESRKVCRAYKELKSLNIVKRIRQQKYLINPKVALPAKGNYGKVKLAYSKFA